MKKSNKKEDRKWLTQNALAALTKADRRDVGRWLALHEIPCKQSGKYTVYDRQKSLAAIRSHRTPEEAKSLRKLLGKVKVRKAFVVAMLKRFEARRETQDPRYFPLDDFRKAARDAGAQFRSGGFLIWIYTYGPQNFRQNGQFPPCVVELGIAFAEGFERHAVEWAQERGKDATEIEHAKFGLEKISKLNPSFLQRLHKRLGSLAVAKCLTKYAELEIKERELFEAIGGDLVPLESVDGTAGQMAVDYFDEHMAKPLAAFGYKGVELGGTYDPPNGKYDLMDRFRKEFEEDFVGYLGQVLARNQWNAPQDCEEKKENAAVDEKNAGDDPTAATEKKGA